VGVHNRAVDSVGLRSSMDLLACAGERALHAGERETCTTESTALLAPLMELWNSEHVIAIVHAHPFP
jgi:hypothetical protein